MSSEPLRAGMIGAGNMGGRMGRRIAAAGDPIIAYDANAETLAECGMEAAGSVADLVQRIDVIMLSLPDSSVIEPVVLGEDGVLAHARAGQIVVDLSTANPASTRRLHAAFADKGVRLIDAGISGGAKGAEKGTLTIMTGGDPEALAVVAPLLDRFATKVVHMGDSGAGHVAKVLNNYLNAIALAATSEVMVAARKADLDLARLLEVLNSSSGVNFATRERFPSIVKGDYLEGGLTGRLMSKDVRLYLQHVADAGVPTFTGPGTLAAFDMANAMGYGDVISNRVVDGIGDLAGGVRLYDGGDAS